MARKSKKKRKKKAGQPRRAPLRILLQRGAEAWWRGREPDALRLWSRAWEKSPTPELAAALGELYFRRGVRAVATGAGDDDAFLSGVADLERAGELLPGDERPLYHLGLAHHRRSEIEKATSFYHQVLELRPDHRRAAYHLALAALEQRRDPTKTSTWALLSPAQQTDLRAAWHLVCKQCRRMRKLPDAFHPLWLALAALDGLRADKSQARQMLEQVLAQEKSKHPRARLAHIYLGNLLWPDDQLAAARHWDRAARSTVPPWVECNRAVGADLLARQALEEDDYHAALPYARIALEYAPESKPYREVMARIHFLSGNQAAAEERWDKAVKHWEQAHRLGAESQPLFHNLALGYEHLERWNSAAQAWRDYLRRRPRRPVAQTLVHEGQVRSHIASLYMRAGREKEAIRFYTQALAAHAGDEEEIPLRLELAELLTSRDNWSKAEKLLREGLKRHPDHPEILQALGLLYEERGQSQRALDIWKQALRSSPDHPLVRERMAEHLSRQADKEFGRHNLRRACELYEQALEYALDKTEIGLDLVDTYYNLDRTDEALKLIDKLLEQAPNAPNLLGSLVDFWLYHDRDDQVAALLQRAEGLDQERLATFYIFAGTSYYRYGYPQQGEQLLRRAIQAGPIPTTLAVRTAIPLLKQKEYNIAVSLLERVLQFDPGEPIASVLLGLAYALQGKRGRARSVISEARRIARQIGDHESVSMLNAMARDVRYAPDTVLSMLSLIAPGDI